MDKDEYSKTLGINWSPSKDLLQYKITENTSNTKSCTKRVLLSKIAQIFDPLGSLGSIITTAKIMLQNFWKLKVDWDESLPIDVQTQWLKYVSSLSTLKIIHIPRCIINLGRKSSYMDFVTQV